jgi:hypothetical protein
MKSEVCKRKVATWRDPLASILDAAAPIKKREVQLRRKHTIFAHELQAALRLTVGFSKIHYELLQICHLNIKLILKYN